MDNFNDYRNQSLLLSNIHSFSLWKIYYCYDKNKQQKEKTEQKSYLYGKFGVQNFRVSSWKMMTLCYSVSCAAMTIFGSYKWWQLSSVCDTEVEKTQDSYTYVWESRGKEWHTASLLQRFLLSLNEILLIAYLSWTPKSPFPYFFVAFFSPFPLLSSILTHNWAFENEFWVEPAYQPTFICLWKTSSTTDTSSHHPFQ